MALTHEQIASLALCLAQDSVGSHLQGFNEFDQESFFWSLSNKRRLVFCLSHQFPRVYLGGESLDGSSLNTAFSSFMRKGLSNARILDVTAEPDERILRFHLERTNDVYKKEKVFLVFEMLPIKPRLLLLDETGKILISTHYSSLESKRPLLRGMTYSLPDHGAFKPKPGEPFSYEDYNRLCLEQERHLLEDRQKSKYGDYIKKLKTKQKAAAKKIAAIKGDIEEAKSHLDDGIYGDAIFTDFSSFHKGDASFVYEGKTIPLDEKKSPQENATAFYKRAKKAKTTLETAKLSLAKAEEELENVTAVLEMIDTLEPTALEELGAELGILPSPKAKEVAGKALLPYFVDDGKTRYLFGKNAKQNEFLSFLYTTDKEAYWFHITPGSGAHVVLTAPSPSNEEITLACELALLASNQESGEVMYTKRKNIKRGNYVGQAIVKTYQSAHFTSVSDKAKALYASATKLQTIRHLQGNQQ